MQVDELLHVVHLVIKRKAEAAEDLRHHLHADEVVVVEGPAEALVKALGAGLPDVVEERCPEEPEIHLVPRAGGGECLGHIVHDLIGVGEVVLVADAVTRLGALELEELGEDELHQAGLLKELEADGWARGEEDLIELRGDAFGGDDLDAPCISPDSSEGVGVDEEAELRGEAYGTHHAQRVIAEGDVGIEWRAQGERLHIVQAVEGVDELTEAVGIQADGQSIDREVTALLIFLQRAVLDEGLATVGRVALATSAYEFDLQVALLDLCRAEASEDRDVCTTPEAPRYRLRQVDTAPDGDDVDILRGAVEEEVTHIAPDDVGVYAEFVRGFADEVKEGGVYLVVDLIFLFVEQVFAEHPFLVGFLRLQRYGFLAWGVRSPALRERKTSGAFPRGTASDVLSRFARVRIIKYMCLGFDVVEYAISVGDLTKRAARIADGDDACRDVARDDAACSDHGALADGDATEDRHRAADPHVVTDFHGLALLVACVALLGE